MTEIIPLLQQKNIITGTGDVAVVAGWLKNAPEVLSEQLTPEQYGIIGNLYSPVLGLSPLLRNLLYNPQINHLVLISATSADTTSKSVLILKEFLLHGVFLDINEIGRQCWKVNTQLGDGEIEVEIELDSLNHIRNQITWEWFSVSDHGNAHNTIAMAVKSIQCRQPSPQTRRERLQFPLAPQVEVNNYPCNPFGHTITAKTIAQAWIKILHRIQYFGIIEANAHGGKWQQLLKLNVVITDEPQGVTFPDPNYLPCDADFLKEYIPTLTTDLIPDGQSYTYGSRIHSYFETNQFVSAIDRLCKELNTAGVYISLWDAKTDVIKPGSPCLVGLWAYVIDGKFHLIAELRSNDMYSAWPSNAYALRALQFKFVETLLERGIQVEVGNLLTSSNTAHTYDTCWADSTRQVEKYYKKIFYKELMEFADPIGVFIIEVSDSDIKVNLASHHGNLLRSWHGKNALMIGREISKDIPMIQASHAVYLGQELQKAEIAITHHLKYVQDQPLKAY